MNRDEAHKLIQQYVKEAYDALTKATEISDKTLISFDFSPAYGMGGWYSPEPPKLTRGEALKMLEQADDLSFEMKDYLGDVIANTTEVDDEWSASSDYYNEYGWRSSSSSC